MASSPRAERGGDVSKRVLLIWKRCKALFRSTDYVLRGNCIAILIAVAESVDCRFSALIKEENGVCW